VSQVALSTVLDRTRKYLGVKRTDPEFPVTHLTDVANTCLSDLYDDCIRLNENEAALTITVVPDTGTERTYTLSAQSTALVVLRIVELRVRNGEGSQLIEMPLSQRDAYRGLSYSLLGPEGAQVIETSTGVQASQDLWMRYIPILAELDDEQDLVPAFLPGRYRDVLALMIAREVWPQGGEASFPGEMADRLDARTSQLYEVWSKRSTDPMIRRDHSAGITPYLF
jgi:hypothetical protein